MWVIVREIHKLSHLRDEARCGWERGKAKAERQRQQEIERKWIFD